MLHRRLTKKRRSSAWRSSRRSDRRGSDRRIGADASGLRQRGVDQCDDIADAPVLDPRPMKW
jgi:hypothetical protein